MFEGVRKILSKFRRKGGIIGQTVDDLWFFRSSFRFGRDILSTNRFQASVWAYRSILKIAENIASVELLIVQEKGNEEAPVRDRKILNLFDRPNPDYSFREMLKRTAMLLDTWGEAFWYLERKNIAQVPTSMRLLHPRHMRAVTNEKGDLLYWVYREKEKLEPFELVHFKHYNPIAENNIRGLSPLDVVMLSIEQDFLSSLFNRNFFEQGAVLSGYIKVPETLSDAQFRRLRQQFEDRHAGVSKAHRIAVLEGGMDFKESQITQRDMQFVDMKKITREEIFTAFGTNPVVLGIYEDVKSYEGIKTAHKTFWQETIIPRLKLMEDTLYHSLFAHIGDGSLYPRFDLANVEALQEDFDKKVEVAEKLWKMGYPLNEINRRLELGLAEVPWGDSWWAEPTKVPMGSMDGSTGGKAAPPPQPQTKDASKEEFEKIRYWEQFVEDVYTPLEEALQKKVKGFFYRQRVKVLENIRSLPSLKALVRKDYAEILLDWDGELRELRDILERFYEKAVDHTLEYTSKEIGWTGFAYEPLRKEMLGTLNLRIKTIPEQILRTIKKDLKLAITEGLVQGESINEIQDRVRKVYNMASSRALTIARTETVSAVMSGRMKMFEQAGVKKNMWVTAKDEHVRSSHAQQDGYIQLVGKKFPNGCRFPGDPTAPAAEVINCRCVLVPVVKDTVFTGREPKVEIGANYAGWMDVMTPAARKKLEQLGAMDYIKNLEYNDPRLVKVFTRLAPTRIRMTRLSKNTWGEYTPASGEISLQSAMTSVDRVVSTLFHEMTHLAQAYSGGKRTTSLANPLPLLRDETKMAKALKEILEKFDYHPSDIQDIFDALFPLYPSFSQYEKEKMGYERRISLFGTTWRTIWEVSLKGASMSSELVSDRFRYHLTNLWEFQAVLIEVRALGILRQGSPLWELTEAIIDDVEDIGLGGAL